MPEPEIPDPAQAHAVADRFTRSVEAFRSVPSAFDRAVASALDVIAVEWTREKTRELHEQLRDVLGKQLVVLDMLAPSATAAAELAAHAQSWSNTRDSAAQAQDDVGDDGRLRATGTWRGAAGRDYAASAGVEAAITGSIAGAADGVAAALAKLAVAGTAFTIAAGAVIEKTTADLTAQTGALASGVGTLRELGKALQSAVSAGEFITGVGSELIEAVRMGSAKLSALDQAVTASWP